MYNWRRCLPTLKATIPPFRAPLTAVCSYFSLFIFFYIYYYSICILAIFFPTLCFVLLLSHFVAIAWLTNLLLLILFFVLISYILNRVLIHSFLPFIHYYSFHNECSHSRTNHHLQGVKGPLDNFSWEGHNKWFCFWTPIELCLVCRRVYFRDCLQRGPESAYWRPVKAAEEEGDIHGGAVVPLHQVAHRSAAEAWGKHTCVYIYAYLHACRQIHIHARTCT